MADTRIQHDAEEWIIDNGLVLHFPCNTFHGKKLELIWGGFFNFDAVSQDDKIVCSISTSSARTASGNLATAKIQKLKTDALYLLNIKKTAKLAMVFTESNMRDHFSKEVNNGRFPSEIELLHIQLPHHLHEKVLESRMAASKETSPRA